MRSISLLMAVPSLSVIAVFACGGDDTTGPTTGNGTPTVASIVVTPSNHTLTSLGETVRLSADARDANGNTISGKTFTWSSSDTNCATVSSSGLATAEANGTAAILATTDGVSGSSSFTVAQMFAAISAGNSHTCGITTGRTAYCWGANASGQLGNASDTASAHPVPVVGNHHFIAITSGKQNHTCGLTAEGEAYCWGQNSFGQLGDGSTTNSNVPLRAAGDLMFRSLDAGVYHTCGITSTGKAYCWGANGPANQYLYGVDGEGFALGAPALEFCENPSSYRGSPWPCSTTPVAVSGGLSFRSISAALWGTCGVTLNGSAYCWGLNFGYQLGNETLTGATTPTLVAGELVFDRVVLGATHGCGLVGHDAYCWGGKIYNFGQLGTGSFETSSTPTSVAMGLDFSDVMPSSANNI